eukprot:c19776_g1_i1.p1 GENE.c19776_g1_i1~~c19776_g1_i1.p1  ORF type:complete len:681 (+),score=209.28 c19776_g1_i1:281-2323(+)
MQGLIVVSQKMPKDLKQAAWDGNHTQIESLLERNTRLVDSRDENGATPLHHAAEKGHLEVLFFLVQHGAIVNAVNDFRNTPLHQAASQGHLDAVEFLLQSGANVHGIPNSGFFSTIALAKSDRNSPLHCAAMNGHEEVVQRLLEHGANVNDVTKKRRTVLHDAAFFGRAGVVRVLLSHGANINALTKGGETARELALREGHEQVVTILDQALWRVRLRAFLMGTLRRGRNNNNNNNDPSAVDEIVDIREPYHVFKGLHIFELEDLKQDIEARIAAQTHVDYWQALLIVCEDTLTAARAEEHANPNAQTGDRFATTGVHRVIEKDILEDLSGKSYDELRELQESISNKLEQGGVDAEYWEALLKRVVVQRAKAKLSDIHADLLRKKLALLQSQQIQRIRALNEEDEIVRLREEAEGKQMQPDDKSETQNNSDDDGKGETRQATKGRKSGGKQRTANKQTSETDAEYVCPPSPIANYKPEKDEIVWNASDDEREITQLREQVLFTVKQRAKDDEDVLRRAENKRIDDMVKAEAERGMENGDSAFNIEVPLGTSDQVVWWHDKYRPRKPRYFNRVHTGFEWNKYNQTHYDHDNPPPKTVQGYKFNIFYPDLIDPTQTPRYFIEPGENPDVAMIRFHAGPPYEDIAFKIVNKEFDTGRKSGYKCTFDRGVLHLYFNFKRHRYRR